jgi:hypothetical protein
MKGNIGLRQFQFLALEAKELFSLYIWDGEVPGIKKGLEMIFILCYIVDLKG